MIRVIKNSLYFVFGSAVTIALIFGSPIAVWWAWDVHQDRQHTLSVNSPTPIFVGDGDEYCDDRPQLTTIPSGTNLQVRRIRYWKNCATINVTLLDGRKGYVVLGVGNVSVNFQPR